MCSSDLDAEEPDADTPNDTTDADAEEPVTVTNAEEADAEEPDAATNAEEVDDTTPDTDDGEAATDELTTAPASPDSRESEHDRAADETEANANVDTDAQPDRPDGAEDPTEPGSTRQHLRSMIARANDLLDQPSKSVVDSPYAKLFRYLLGLSGTLAKRGVEQPQYDENRLRLASLARKFSGRPTLRRRAEQQAPQRQAPTPPRLGPRSVAHTFGYLARLSTHIEPGDIAAQLQERAERIRRNLQEE